MDQENFLIEEGNFLTEYSVKRKRFPELWPSVIIRQRILHYSDQLWPVHHNPSGSMNLKLFMGVWNSSHAIPFSICLRSLSLSLSSPLTSCITSRRSCKFQPAWLFSGHSSVISNSGDFALLVIWRPQHGWCPVCTWPPVNRPFRWRPYRWSWEEVPIRVPSIRRPC